MVEVEIIAEFDTKEAAEKFRSDAEECIGKNNGELMLSTVIPVEEF